MPMPLTVCLIVAALFLLLWLFLIAPRARRAAVKPFLRPYAHRGLWGEGAPENSLAAFRRAVEHGFAIELDVQCAKDGTVMVFHDYTLTRMCGKDVKLAELSAEELGACMLGDTDERIPTFREVLEIVDGKVPLLVELKGESSNVALVPAALKVLEGYTGLWCMESFNPLLLRAVKKQAPHVVRGLLSSDLVKEKHTGSKALNFALSALWLTFLCRPAFHAWDKKYPRRLALLAGIKLFGAASFVYTVKDEELAKEYMAKGTYPIFDNFDPKSF